MNRARMFAFPSFKDDSNKDDASPLDPIADQDAHVHRAMVALADAAVRHKSIYGIPCDTLRDVYDSIAAGAEEDMDTVTGRCAGLCLS